MNNKYVNLLFEMNKYRKSGKKKKRDRCVTKNPLNSTTDVRTTAHGKNFGLNINK